MCEKEGEAIYRLLERGVIHNTIKKDQSIKVELELKEIFSNDYKRMF